MSNIELIRSFQKITPFSKGTLIQKMRGGPTKLFYLKLLELIAFCFEKSIKVKAKTFWGDYMFVFIPEIVSLNIYRYGFFEEGLTRMILEYLKSGMTFFDIGAHFGYFTLLGSTIVGDEGQVHSFEPVPSTFNILKANTLSKKNIFLNKLAVLSNRKSVLINDYDIKYSAFNSIYSGRLPRKILSKLKAKRVEIETISIDEYVRNTGAIPDFIKIDAENSEYEILIGMEKTINSTKPIITVEVGDIDVEDVPETRDIINFLLNKGYKPYEYKEGNIIKHDVKKEKYSYDNILFLPDK